MRTIHIVFVEKKDNIINTKQYKFLCPYDFIKVGDVIEDERYHPYLQVVNITSSDKNIQDGRYIKTIKIKSLNMDNTAITRGDDYDIDVSRSMNVTLKQAMEWYNSDNISLRTLALKLYSRQELEFNYSLLESKTILSSVAINIPAGENKKFQVLAKLAVIAKYFNKDWVKTSNNTGYFIGKYHKGKGPIIECYRDAGVYKHGLILYAGIIYFKQPEDAIKAIKILGDEVKFLFN